MRQTTVAALSMLLYRIRDKLGVCIEGKLREEATDAH